MLIKENKYILKFLELLFLFLFLSLLFNSNTFYNSYQLSKSFSITICSLLIFILFLMNQITIKFTLTLFVFLLFIFYINIKNFFLSNSPSVSYSLTLFIIPFLFFTATIVKINFKKFCYFICGLVLISMLYGFLQTTLNIQKPYSFFGNPIFFGEFIAISFPLIIYLLLFEKNNLLLIFIIIGILFTLLLIGSKGVLSSFVIASLFLLYYILKQNLIINFKIKNNLFKIFSVLFLFLIFLFFIPNLKKTFIDNIKSFNPKILFSSPSIINRATMWKSAINMIKEKPVFGFGTGAVRYFYQKYQSEILKKNQNLTFIKTSYVHNDYLQITAEFGIIGLFLFVLFIISLIYFFDKNSYLLDIKEYFFSICIISSLIFILCESFFNFPLFVLPSSAIFFICSGILYSIIIKYQIYLKENKFFSNVFLVSILIFITIIIAYNTKPIISNIYSAKALSEGKKNSPMEAYYYQKAITINKNDYIASFNLGMHYFLKRDYENSIKYFKYALSIYPYSADAIYNIATIYKSIDEKKQSEEFFKKTLELYPNNIQANLNLGKLYLNLGKTEEGLKYISFAKQIAPNYIDTEQLIKVLDFKEVTNQ